ncbi:MAG: IS1380 family transposase [Lentisphaerae bacterium]|nr:IS1380 family transposase [Lentisphaerota bacterium]
MTQGILPFKYEIEKTDSGMTALAGLPLYLDLAKVTGLTKSIGKYLKIRKNKQGWTDTQMVLAIVMLNIAGGSKVSDLKTLECDTGFCKILQKAELHGLRRKVRRSLELRWRKEKKRTIPSPSAAFRYLANFHDSQQEQKRSRSNVKAFIPAPTSHLNGLMKVNRDMLLSLQSQNYQTVATLDMDATLIETNKKESLYCYKNYKAYQPLNVYWAEQEVILHTEFRDGNVPAGYEQLRVLKESLRHLPSGVEKVRLRSDTAGYQHDLMKFCDTCDEHFGKIEFAIGADVTVAFKKAVTEVGDAEWKPLYKTVNGKQIKTESEWAEVCFVPNKIGHSKKGLEYRYLAKRQILDKQCDLPGMNEDDGARVLPFPTMSIESNSYKIFGFVTNITSRDMKGCDVINWLHKRCGKSEAVHAVMKDDLAGGILPSGSFGENAAWWSMMIIALNLNVIMKKLALSKDLVNCRMKAIRYSIISIPGRIIKRSHYLFLRLSKNHPSFDLLIEARRKIANIQLKPLKPG